MFRNNLFQFWFWIHLQLRIQLQLQVQLRIQLQIQNGFSLNHGLASAFGHAAVVAVIAAGIAMSVLRRREFLLIYIKIFSIYYNTTFY